MAKLYPVLSSHKLVTPQEAQADCYENLVKMAKFNKDLNETGHTNLGRIVIKGK